MPNNQLDIMQLGMLLFLILIAAGGMLLFGVFMKRRKPGGDSDMNVFRDLNPQDLSSLKSKGLLTEDEAKKLQRLIASKTIETMDMKSRAADRQMDTNELLAEVEQFRMRHDKKSSQTHGEQE